MTPEQAIAFIEQHRLRLRPGFGNSDGGWLVADRWADESIAYGDTILEAVLNAAKSLKVEVRPVSSNIPNEPDNRPARDYDRQIDRLNEGEDEPILDPEDRQFAEDLVEGLRELATEAQTASAAVAEFGEAARPYAEDEDFVAGAVEALSDFVERKA